MNLSNDGLDNKNQTQSAEHQPSPPEENPKWIDFSREVELHHNLYRPNTHSHPVAHNFFFTGGGLGDYICWSIAIRYVHQYHVHVDIKLFVPTYTLELFQNIFAKMPRVEVFAIETFEKDLILGSPIIGNLHQNQLLNALGCHLIDNGFAYYANMCPAPENAQLTYPEVDTYKVSLHAFDIPKGPYAVMTPGATSPTRTMKPQYFNALKNYIIDAGITPVFLGQNELIGSYKATFDDGYDYSGGVDLRNATTLLEATKIIQGAKFIMGLDNGLLHLAACTSTPIICGYTVANPETRRPIRVRGVTLDIVIPEERLACAGCQVKFRFTPGHSFRTCLYKDFKCLDEIFAGDCGEWREAIDLILKQTRHTTKE